MMQYRVRIVLETTDEAKGLWHQHERFHYTSQVSENGATLYALYQALLSVAFYWRFP